MIIIRKKWHVSVKSVSVWLYQSYNTDTETHKQSTATLLPSFKQQRYKPQNNRDITSDHFVRIRSKKLIPQKIRLSKTKRNQQEFKIDL